MRKTRYKGRWTKSNLTAKCISRMMGVEVTKAKRYLYGLKKQGIEVDEAIVGQLIQLVRNKEELKMIKKVLNGKIDFEGTSPTC